MSDYRVVFLDTGYAVALANHKDQHRAAALVLASRFQGTNTRMVTTRAVLLEIGASLAQPHLRAAAVQVLDDLETDSGVETVEVDAALYRRGLTLFRQRPDKGWTVTDCVSFITMKDRGIRDALAHDRHFEQAGFCALMRLVQ